MIAPPCVVLIETASSAIGSMPSYAELVAHALRAQSVLPLHVQRVNLAPTEGRLGPFPGALRTAAVFAALSVRARALGQKRQATLFHVMDGSQAHIVPWLHSRRVITTVHDLIPRLQCAGCFRTPRPGRPARWLIRRNLRGVARSSRILAVSDNTAADLVRWGRIARTAIDVVAPPLPVPMAAEALRNAGEPWHHRRMRHAPFVLHVGNNAFYKNRVGVLRVFSHLGSVHGVRLCMAGPRPTASILRIANSLGVANRVDFVIDPECPALADLYRRACLLLFPSVYEGYGWPPLEAMAFGCPVVCSSSGSLPEVVGDGASLAPFDDEAALASRCREVLDNEALAGALVARGRARVARLTVEGFGERLARIYEELLCGA